jgi:predicted amidohydrolase
VLGFLERIHPPRKIHNTAVLIGREGLLTVYRKIHLPGIGVDRFTTPGMEPFRVHHIAELDLRLGLHICYDGGFPEATRVLALEGADLAVLPTNWATGTEAIAEHLPSCRAMENVIYFAAVNRVGTEGDFTYIGRSSAADPSGRVLARASADREEMILFDLNTARARSKKIVRIPGKAEVDRFRDRRPEFYGRLVMPQ